MVANAQQSGKELYEGQFAPSFSIKDLEGKFHSIEQYKGQKILLSFYRNVGCSVSNLRFHQIESEQEYLRKKGIVVLAVYESPSDHVKLFLDTNQYYQVLLPNPDGSLYELYGVEENKSKITKGALHGSNQKSKAGKKLFTQKLKQDGPANRIAADFLIDENGNIIAAYYGKYLGDNMPIEFIKQHTN